MRPWVCRLFQWNIWEAFFGDVGIKNNWKIFKNNDIYEIINDMRIYEIMNDMRIYEIMNGMRISNYE